MGTPAARVPVKVPRLRVLPSFSVTSVHTPIFHLICTTILHHRAPPKLQTRPTQGQKSTVSMCVLQLFRDADLGWCVQTGLCLQTSSPASTQLSIAWSSKRQQAASRSTAEAEGVSLADCLATETLSVQDLLSKVCGRRIPLRVREDNLGRTFCEARKLLEAPSVVNGFHLRPPKGLSRRSVAGVQCNQTFSPRQWHSMAQPS